MDWLGIDIGGANLKLADGKGFAESYAFDLWQRPRDLAQELRTLIAQAPSCDHLAVTMTAELADCFETKQDGVRSILDSVQQASDGRHTRVYLTNGMLVTPQVASSRTSEVAAANWHALAQFAARFCEGQSALLVDIGSTTCDVVPLVGGRPAASGKTDTDRLLAGELVYTGVQRTPLCALADNVPYRGRLCPLAREVFATTQDLYLLTGDLPEDAGNTRTADGRPATKAAARIRLGRIVCADADQFNHRDAVTMAESLVESHAEIVATGIRQVVAQLKAAPTTLIASGGGEFLLGRVLRGLRLSADVVSLGRKLGPRISRCGPAHALAVLAREAMEW